MKKTFFLVLAIVVSMAIAAAGAAQESATLRFLCFQDGKECDEYANFLARAESLSDISVAVDVVPEAEVAERLAAAGEAGEGYDFARVSDLNALAGQLLDLRPQLGDLLEATFRAVYFEAARARQDDEALYGFPDALDMVAPFVNVSLFEQAGVTLPGAGASWDEWLAALDEVVEATDASYVLSVDNKDHRLVGPAMSLGAQYFDDEGNLTLPDAAGLRDFLQILHGLMEAGKTPADTLLGTGKSQEYFARGETAMYICGSWKAEEVAAQVGDDFEWAIAPNPSGADGGTGVALTNWLVAFADTEQPEAVANVFEYLLAPEASAEFAARSLTVPAREDLAADGVDYQTDKHVVADALNSFAREAPKLQDQAIMLDSHPLAPDYYEASNANLRAYFAGDLTLDEALDNLKARLREAGEP